MAPLPKVRVEVNLSGPYSGNFFRFGDPDRGRLDNYPFASSLIWADVTEYVRSWEFTYGASQGNAPVRRYEPGTARIVLNDGDRRFDPDNASSPYASGGVSQILPMVRVRIVAEWAGVAYPLWTGFADDWSPEYIGNEWTYTTLTATDGTKVWAKDNRQAASAGFAGELSGARVNRVLNSINWPIEDRLISTGVTPLQATTLAGPANSELQSVQDTEMGDVFIDGAGRVVFYDRQTPSSRTASAVSQGVFGDAGYDLTGEIPYSDVTRTSADQFLANRVMIQRNGGALQTVNDLTSQARYLIKAFSVTSDLIMQTDAEALAYAESILYQYKDTYRRFDKISFLTPALDVEDATWPQLLGRQIGDRITVRRRPAPVGSTVIESDCFIRGISMNSDGDSWSTSWTLQSAARFSYFRFGDPERGKLDRYPFRF